MNHKTVLKKYETIGFNNLANDWFESILYSRKFYVALDNVVCHIQTLF